MKTNLGTPAIRVLVLLEGSTLTGPVKNVLEFCRLSRALPASTPVCLSLATFVRSQGQGAKANQFLEEAAAQQVDVHTITERSAFDFRGLGRLKHLARQLSPDIVETHSVKSHFLVRLSGLSRAYPWIAFHHGYTNEGVKMWLYNQLDRWSLRAPTELVTVCEPFKKELASRGAPYRRIRVLHNGIAPDWLNQGRTGGPDTDNGIPSTQGRAEAVVLAIGRLSREKAFPDLVAAVERFGRLRRGKPVRLVIVGEGAERARIEQAARDLAIQDRVTLVGQVSDVRPYYRMADVVAISSLSEGSPNVLLEAMAAGVPVVATSVGGIPEMVAGRDAVLLVEPANPDAMAAAIARLLADSESAHRMAANACQLVATQYSPQNRARWLLDLYASVGRRGAGAEVNSVLEPVAGETKGE